MARKQASDAIIDRLSEALDLFEAANQNDDFKAAERAGRMYRKALSGVRRMPVDELPRYASIALRYEDLTGVVPASMSLMRLVLEILSKRAPANDRTPNHKELTT